MPAQMRLRILEQWNSYRKQVLPADASDVQVTECRRAFYGGAQAFYSTVMGGLGPGSEAEEADFKLMEDLATELKDFSKQVANGRA
jgi:hypothetical protein